MLLSIKKTCLNRIGIAVMLIVMIAITLAPTAASAQTGYGHSYDPYRGWTGNEYTCAKAYTSVSSYGSVWQRISLHELNMGVVYQREDFEWYDTYLSAWGIYHWTASTYWRVTAEHYSMSYSDYSEWSYNSSNPSAWVWLWA